MASADVYGIPISEVINNHRRMILQRAYMILGDQGEAEDVASQVYSKLYRKAHLFKQGSSVTTWIGRITTNAAIDAYRSRRKSPLFHPVDLETVSYRMGHNPEKKYITQLDTEKFLGMLSPEKRDILVMSNEGYTYEEIAEVMDIPATTVKTRLHRLREEAKAFLLRGRLPSPSLRMDYHRI